jgi:hypothetical protein
LITSEFRIPVIIPLMGIIFKPHPPQETRMPLNDATLLL